MINIPTTVQLYNSIISDIQTSYGGTLPVFGKNFLRVMAGVQAAKLRLYYLAIGNLQKNIFVDTADPEASGGTLERFGRIKLGRNPYPARAGQYTVNVTGSPGAIIPILATFKSNDDASNPGKLFQLDSQFTFAGSSGVITLRALEAGLNSKLFPGEGLTITAPAPNVNKSAVVANESVQPLAPEDIEEYREKAEEAYQLEPQGGAPSDYRIWAADAQGVEQVYPFATSGASAEVDLFIEATIADSTDGKGSASPTMLADVESVIELDPDTTKPINDRGRRPIGVFQVHYYSVDPQDIDIDIADFENLTADKQALIFNSIKELLDNIRPYVSGADVLADKNDLLNVNIIVAAIFNAVPNANFGTITLTVGGLPVSFFLFTNGNIPYLNSVSYS